MSKICQKDNRDVTGNIEIGNVLYNMNKEFFTDVTPLHNLGRRKDMEMVYMTQSKKMKKRRKNMTRIISGVDVMSKIYKMLISVLILSVIIQTVSAEPQSFVKIKDVNGNPSFVPASITVLKGTTVIWTNNGVVSHTVTSDTGIFDSGIINPGKTFKYTFNNVGTFKYHCSPHSFMHGTIKVVSSTSGITVTSPNGGENWKKGTTKIIKWSYTGNIGTKVKIELLKGGKVNKIIASNAPNSGSYKWIIPSVPVSGDYKVRITSVSNSKYNDVSNNKFKIS